MKFEFLVFRPYKEEPLVEIVKNKLTEILNEEFDLLSEKGLSYLAKQAIKSNSGDVRFMLSVIREAFGKKLDQIEIDDSKELTLNDIKIGVSELSQIVVDKYNKKEKEIVLSQHINSQMVLLALHDSINNKKQKTQNFVLKQNL